MLFLFERSQTALSALKILACPAGTEKHIHDQHPRYQYTIMIGSFIMARPQRIDFFKIHWENAPLQKS
jgi:hypothetical protein